MWHFLYLYGYNLDGIIYTEEDEEEEEEEEEEEFQRIKLLMRMPRDERIQKDVR